MTTYIDALYAQPCQCVRCVDRRRRLAENQSGRVYIENLITDEPKINHIDKVREALELYASDATWGKDDWGILAINVREYGMPGREAHAALSALQAHEAEAKELREASTAVLEMIDAGIENASMGQFASRIGNLRAALTKVKP